MKKTEKHKLISRRFLALVLSAAMLLTMTPWQTANASDGSSAASQVSDSGTTSGSVKKSSAKKQIISTTSNSLKQASATSTPNVVSSSGLVYGDGSVITRAEWVHDLVVLFEMTVEEDNFPDNYYSDLTEESEYYQDIMLAVEFGVIDLEAGEAFQPDEPADREFAVHTLNYCLGYQLDEEAEYSFSDTDALDENNLADAQIALNRGWVVLENGEFSPDKNVTKAEVTTMIEDVEAVKSSTEIEENYDNQYQFADGVIEVPETTAVGVDQDKVVTIYDTSLDIAQGDTFAVYVNGVPNTYQAETVSLSDTGNALVITTTDVAMDQMVETMDAQGSVEADLGQAEAIGDTKIVYVEDDSATPVSGAKIGGSVSVKAIKFSKTMTLAQGVTAKFSGKISGITVDYKAVKENGKSQYYVAANGTADLTVNGNVNGLEAAGLPTSIDLVYVPVGGVGSFKVTAEYDISGSISVNYVTDFKTGVQYTDGEGFRLVQNFKKKSFSISSEMNLQAGVKVAFSIDKMPGVSGSLYAKAGARTHLISKIYTDGEKPEHCVNISSYLYASVGGSIKFAIINKSYKKEIEIYSESNSPVRVVYHYEDNKLIGRCTRNPNAYYTSYDSQYGSCPSGYGVDAEGNVVPVFTYTVDDDGNATVTGYTGRAHALIIPEEIDGYTVVGIGASAFQERTDLVSVVMPDTVTKIGNWAFENCTSLSEVQLSKHLEEIGGKAFGNSTELTDITIPKSLLTAYTVSGGGCGAFYKSGIKNVSFEEGITSIIANLFTGAEELEEIEIPETVTSIGHNAFEGCSGLRKIIIPDYVTKIGNWAFENCTSLSEVQLSKHLEEIGGKAFGNCTELTDITIPKSLLTAYTVSGDGCGAFYKSGIKNVSFEEGITSIIANLFTGAEKLEEIEIPETVTSIGHNAFEGCSGLRKIVIPDYVTKIGNWAFENCTSLSEVQLSKHLEEIGGKAFGNCTELTDITIPKSLLTAYTVSGDGCGAFYKSGIKNVSFEEGITSIIANLFTGAEELEEIEIPETVTSIGHNAFEGCSGLKKIVIPNQVTELGSWAFSGCTSLLQAEISDNITTIEKETFLNCSSLQNVKLPNRMTSIGINAFKNTNLSTITLPETVTSISEGAFCSSSLESIVLPDALTSIGDSVFKECANLTQIKIGKNVTKIGNYAFYSCDSLEKISIPDSVNSLGNYIFAECDKLSEVILGNGIKTIPSYAFYQVPKLTNIVIPYRVTTIKDHAFANCIAFKDITIPKSVTTIESAVFSYPDEVTVYGQTGSYAETYANENNCTFISHSSKATAVMLNVQEIVLGKGKTKTLVLSILPIDFTDDVKWESSDQTVATINDDGVVTGVGVGTCTITVSVGDVTTQCAVTVYIPVTQIKVTGETEITQGIPVKLSTTVSPYNASDSSVTWSSSDTSIATVDDSGNVTGLKEGKVTIIATAKDGSGVTGSMEITVKKKEDALELQPDSGLNLTEDGLLTGVSLGSNTVKDVCASFINSNLVCKDTAGNVLEEDALLGTGYTISIVDGDTVTAQCQVVLTGDVFGDGTVNLKDVSFVAQYCANKKTLTEAQLAAADVFSDDSINVKDISKLARYCAGKATL